MTFELYSIMNWELTNDRVSDAVDLIPSSTSTVGPTYRLPGLLGCGRSHVVSISQGMSTGGLFELLNIASLLDLSWTHRTE
jgi:hypothetical protein